MEIIRSLDFGRTVLCGVGVMFCGFGVGDFIKVDGGCGGVSVCRIIGVGVYVIVSFAATGPGL